MAYPEKGAQYAGADRVSKICRADGGAVDDENGAVKTARTLNNASRMLGVPYNKGAVSVQTNADMVKADQISDAMRPNQPKR